LEAALKRNEMGDAEVLARLYPKHLRFDHSDETWYVWNGVHWQPDALNSVRHLVNRQVGGQYLQAAAEDRLSEGKNYGNLTKRASNMGRKARLNNVMDLASSLRTFAMEGSEWDADPMLLGAKNGVIDLATGEFRPGRPSDYIQKVAPTRWEGLDAKAPRWEQFLDEIFDGDQELIAFVRRLFGYGITGMHNENIFVILWGHGRNGKDTLLEALGHTLGEALADRVPSDILVGDGGRRGNASPELMELRGQRIAWVSETRKAAKLNVNQVKDITGRSTLKARPLYGNYISFPVQYLLLLLTNNKPVIPADDYAIWKRVLLVPFTLSFVENPVAHNERQRDGTLSRKLAREASGILAWLARGCMEWQKNGLKPPSSVVEATEEYRTEEDVISQFLEEMCYVDKSDPDVYVEARELRKTYNDWANANGERIMRQREFGQRMAKLFQKGKHPDNSKRTTIYLGVGLLGSDSI
jgi:putative DNA primase/helicase